MEDLDHEAVSQVPEESELRRMYQSAESIVHGDEDVITWLVNRLYDIAIAKDENHLSESLLPRLPFVSMSSLSSHYLNRKTLARRN